MPSKLCFIHLKKTVDLFIPSEKATVIATPHSLALNRQHCFDVRDRHEREAGKSAIGLNVADFLKTDSQS